MRRKEFIRLNEGCTPTTV